MSGRAIANGMPGQPRAAADIDDPLARLEELGHGSAVQQMPVPDAVHFPRAQKAPFHSSGRPTAPRTAARDRSAARRSRPRRPARHRARARRRWSSPGSTDGRHVSRETSSALPGAAMGLDAANYTAVTR